MRITIIRRPAHHFAPIDGSVAWLESSRSGPDALAVLKWLHTLSWPSDPVRGTVRRVTCCGELAELAGITPANVKDALWRLFEADLIALQIGGDGDPYLVEVRMAAQLELGPPEVLAKLPVHAQRSIIDVLAAQIAERI